MTEDMTMNAHRIYEKYIKHKAHSFKSTGSDKSYEISIDGASRSKIEHALKGVPPTNVFVEAQRTVYSSIAKEFLAWEGSLREEMSWFQTRVLFQSNGKALLSQVTELFPKLDREYLAKVIIELEYNDLTVLPYVELDGGKMITPQGEKFIPKKSYSGSDRDFDRTIDSSLLLFLESSWFSFVDTLKLPSGFPIFGLSEETMKKVSMENPAVMSAVGKFKKSIEVRLYEYLFCVLKKRV